jgi:thiosulfate dehydrogenase [quinone] large subunit
MTDAQLAYLILRLGTGINFLLHGLVRLPKLSAFATGLAKGFQDTWLSESIAKVFAYCLPFAETTVGLLLLIGLFTRWAAFGAGLIIVALLFGTCLKEDWATAGLQMTYLLVIYFLIAHRSNNAFALDKRHNS